MRLLNLNQSQTDRSKKMKSLYYTENFKEKGLFPLWRRILIVSDGAKITPLICLSLAKQTELTCAAILKANTGIVFEGTDWEKAKSKAHAG